MSLENNIERIANACENMLKIMESQGGSSSTVQSTVEQASQAVTQSAPQQTAVTNTAPQQPAQAANPVQPAAASGANVQCPITDASQLNQYVMKAYREMGPDKGAGIQTILTNLGYSNINEVNPEHYATFWAEIEKMKNA